MTWLLDTVAISEFRKIPAGRADERVVGWARRQPNASLFLSVITVFEIERGILLLGRRDRATAARLRAWLEGEVIPRFADRLLRVDAAVARCCAALQVPDPRPAYDSLIAATAIVHGLTIVTRNVADFAPMGVPVLNPWEA